MTVRNVVRFAGLILLCGGVSLFGAAAAAEEDASAQDTLHGVAVGVIRSSIKVDGFSPSIGGYFSYVHSRRYGGLDIGLMGTGDIELDGSSSSYVNIWGMRYMSFFTFALGRTVTFKPAFGAYQWRAKAVSNGKPYGKDKGVSLMGGASIDLHNKGGAIGIGYYLIPNVSGTDIYQFFLSGRLKI